MPAVADDIVTRLRVYASRGDVFATNMCKDAADEIERLRAEVERLTGENAELQDGQVLNRWPLHKMLAAERALADQLAEALRWSWELTEATRDEVFGTMVAAHGALAAHKEARRG